MIRMNATLSFSSSSRPLTLSSLTAVVIGLGLTCSGGSGLSAAAADPAVGRWGLTIPSGEAGWLEIKQESGWYDGSILWGTGSVVPVASVFMNDGVLNVTRTREVKRKDASGAVIRTQQFTELLSGRVEGDTLHLVRLNPREDGTGIDREEFSGQRMPPLPPKPDLATVKFGDPITLFNGQDLAGWRLVDPRDTSAWAVKDGTLVNRPDKSTGKHFGNLRTDREFGDFRLTLEANVPAKGNSGIYLRGMYEVQVADSFGRPADSHGLGGVYSRITPSVNPAKPAGEWQTFDITLVDRHVTVIVNGIKVIDNQPLLGCTGGALWSDPLRNGPLYLQGDHEAVDYRNIVLRPVVK